MSADDGFLASLRRRVPPLLRKHWATILLVAIALSYSVAVTLMHTKALSPIDEWVYSDYLDKIPTEFVVKQRELIGHTALDRITCDGVFPYGGMGASCQGNYSDVSGFPFGGRTSADPYTPAYFVITWGVGAVIRLVTGLPELTAWRLTSPLWLVATLLVLASLFRLYRVPPLVTLALGLAFIVSPFSWWTYTFVSTDAPCAFFGALLLLLASQRAQGEGKAGWILVISAVAVLFKVTNVLSVGLAALYLLTTWAWKIRSTWPNRSWSERRQTLRSSVLEPIVAVAAVVAAVLVEVVWLAVRKMMADPSLVVPVADQPLSRQALGEQLTNFLQNTITANVTVAGGIGNYALPVFGWAVAPLSWICIAGVVGAFWSPYVRGRYGPLILTTAVASVTFAPILGAGLIVATHSYFSLPPRYGAPLLPAMLLVPALMMRSRTATWLILLYTIVLGIGMLHLTATFKFM